jgi:uncharacterized protein YdeI (BOF family)
MKKQVWLALAAGSFAGTIALAQSQANPNTSPEDQMKARRASASAQSSTTSQTGDMQTVTGTVKSYKPGKKIVVTDASGKKHSLKLDESARVEGTLNPGDSVTVTTMSDSAGKQRVSSITTGSGSSSGTSGMSGMSGMSGSSGSTGGTSPGTAGTPSGEDRSWQTTPRAGGLDGQLGYDGIDRDLGLHRFHRQLGHDGNDGDHGHDRNDGDHGNDGHDGHDGLGHDGHHRDDRHERDNGLQRLHGQHERLDGQHGLDVAVFVGSVLLVGTVDERDSGHEHDGNSGSEPHAHDAADDPDPGQRHHGLFGLHAADAQPEVNGLVRRET